MADLLISINDIVVSPFHEDFIFTKLRICEASQNKTLAKISEFTVLSFALFSILAGPTVGHKGIFFSSECL